MNLAYFFVISAPSGAGKTTIIKKILEKPEFNLRKTLSYTTRKIRKNEKDGVDYNFISTENFEKLIHNNELLEWAKVHDNYYGTSIKQVKEALDTGINLIKDIDTKGAKILKEKLKEKAVLIFINAPSLDDLRNRLSKRQTDCKNTIGLRLENAKKEISESKNYQFTILNDSIENAVTEITKIIKGFYEDKKYKINKI